MRRYMHRWLREPHPSEEELFLAFDASLPARDFEHVRAHLDQCWDCRTKWEQWNAARSDYMLYKHGVQEQVAAPPRNWAQFQVRLNALAADMNSSESPSMVGRLARYLSLDSKTSSYAWAGFAGAVAILVIALWVAIGVHRSAPIIAGDVLRKSEANERTELLRVK